MKGTLHKTEQGWVVEYAKHSELPLHPDDVKQIERDSQVFDNIEARIAAYPNVAFEIVSDTYEKPGKGNTYAKLIPSKEQQKQLITEIMDLDAKDGLYEDAVERFTFKHELQNLINEHSMENGSDTPDFILASFLHSCLESFNHAVRQREQFYKKAQETLYTEEDMLNAFYDGWLSKDLIWKVAKKLFKESLKQSKKD